MRWRGAICAWLWLGMTMGAMGADPVRYTYTAAGRLRSVVQAGQGSLTYEWDPAGNLLRRTFAPLVDSDLDGLPDDWEQGSFSTLSRDGHGDFDGDGQPDLAEFLAGTDPARRDSVFRVWAVRALDAGRLELHFSSTAGKRYRVQSAETLSPARWEERGEVTALEGETVWSETLAGGPSRYYRIVLVP